MITAYLMGLLAFDILFLGVIIFVMFKTRKRRNKLHVSILNIFVMGLFTSIANYEAIAATSEFQASIHYGVYFACIDWLLIFFIVYAREYTNVWPESFYAFGIMVLIAITDTVSQISNVWLGKTFQLVPGLTGPGIDRVYYNPKGLFLYNLHLVYCYILVAVIIIILVKKISITAGNHRNRYVYVLLSFVLVVIVNMIFMMFMDVIPVDLSLYLYMVLALVIAYLTLYYNPYVYLNDMMTIVTENINCAIICYDENDKLAYYSKLAEKNFDLEGKELYLEEQLKKWSGRKTLNQISDQKWEEFISVGNNERYYDIYFRKIYDKSGYYNGCYFSLYDKTVERTNTEDMSFVSRHDSLTGALNRESFYEEVRRMLDCYPNTEYYIICSNIKDFKLINDVFGTDTGDKILIKITDLIRERVREGTVYARLEADRFAILLPKERYNEEMFLDAMGEISSIIDNSLYRMHIHMGVYEITNRRISVTVMCDRAFMAIDSIKSSYRDKIAYYGDTLRSEYQNEQKVIGEFENSLNDNQFRIYLQPQIDKDNVCKGAEALVRWIHPERGIIPPSDFIGILEQTGFIYRLDIFVWEAAAKKLKEWKDLGFEDKYISVNISQKDFYYVDVYQTFVDLVDKYEINPQNLNLEITESAFMNDPKKQVELINKLQSAGFKVEIDDFGSGYSSLSMLKEMSVDILKIDMAFLAVTENEARSRKIVNMVIALAKALDMVVITEGVETKEQVDYLTHAGCDIFQGYYFERPIPVETFEEKYMKGQIDNG